MSAASGVHARLLPLRRRSVQDSPLCHSETPQKHLLTNTIIVDVKSITIDLLIVTNMGETSTMLWITLAQKESRPLAEYSKIQSSHSQDIMRRSRTTRHETLGNGRHIDYCVTMYDEKTLNPVQT
jgi:hypothetical protein